MAWFIMPGIDESVVKKRARAGEMIHYHEFGVECVEDCYRVEGKDGKENDLRG